MLVPMLFQLLHLLPQIPCIKDQKAVTSSYQFIIVCSKVDKCFFLQPPFTHANRKKLQERIIKEKVKLPPFLTSEAHSLLKGVSISFPCGSLFLSLSLLLPYFIL
jgi:hypothetical protein